MSRSGAVGFVKTVVAPLLVAAALYLILSFLVLPFYRRYRADIQRYSQYAPLTSTLQSTTSIFSDHIPEALRPRSIRAKLGDILFRFVLPGMWAVGNRRRTGQVGLQSRRDSTSSSEDGGLFDEESGEAMVGFDMNEGRRAVDGRRRTDGRLAIRDSAEVNAMDSAIGATRHTDESSGRRLSRELEEGFRDDSASEASDEEVTVGRRRLSMAGNR